MFFVLLVIIQLLSKCYRSDSVIYSLAVQLSLERTRNMPMAVLLWFSHLCCRRAHAVTNTKVFVRIRKFQPVPNEKHDVIKHEIGLKITWNNRPNWADI